jgi:hypothetical protein
MADKVLEELLVKSSRRPTRRRRIIPRASRNSPICVPPWLTCRTRCGCCSSPSIARGRASASRSTTTDPPPALDHMRVKHLAEF